MDKENHEIWFEGVSVVNYPRTVLPIENDTIIVGGGITGITSLYMLTKVGKKAVLLEKEKLGQYVTDCTTGFLTEVLDTDPDKLISKFGIKNAKLILQSHREVIGNVEKIVNNEKIECEFERCSYFIYSNNKSEEKTLKKIVKSYKRLDVNAEFKNDNDIRLNEFGYVEIKNQAKFNAIKYITSLAQIATKNGAIIAENTNVLNLNDKKDFVEVNVENVGIIKTKKVFAATYIPLEKNKDLEHKYNMYRSYVLEYKIPKNIFMVGTYQDSLMPYHYFRVDSKKNFDRLVIGGNDNLDILNIDHEIGAKFIRDYTKEFFKDSDFTEIRHWSGYISEPISGLASIGTYESENIFYAFAFSGNGMTYSNIAGKMFFDFVSKQNNSYTELYKIEKGAHWWKNIF